MEIQDGISDISKFFLDENSTDIFALIIDNIEIDPLKI